MDIQEMERQSEELQQTLKKQLEIVKTDSDVYLKVAGMALVAGLATVVTYRLTTSSTPKKKKGKKKVKAKKGYSLWGTLRDRAFWLAVDLGKQALIRRLNQRLEPQDLDER